MTKETENIYQVTVLSALMINEHPWMFCSSLMFFSFSVSLIHKGLNLDECSSKYDVIHRSHNRGPYQDVCNASHEDAFQLEKP